MPSADRPREQDRARGGPICGEKHPRHRHNGSDEASVAKGGAVADSDVDLMVLGDLGLRKLTTLIAAVSERIGREVNPHVMTEREYRKRLRTGDHFVTHVLSGPKLFVTGDQDDLEAMGR